MEKGKRDKVEVGLHTEIVTIQVGAKIQHLPKIERTVTSGEHYGITAGRLSAACYYW